MEETKNPETAQTVLEKNKTLAAASQQTETVADKAAKVVPLNDTPKEAPPSNRKKPDLRGGTRMATPPPGRHKPPRDGLPFNPTVAILALFIVLMGLWQLHTVGRLSNTEHLLRNVTTTLKTLEAEKAAVETELQGTLQELTLSSETNQALTIQNRELNELVNDLDYRLGEVVDKANHYSNLYVVNRDKAVKAEQTIISLRNKVDDLKNKLTIADINMQRMGNQKEHLVNMQGAFFKVITTITDSGVVVTPVSWGYSKYSQQQAVKDTIFAANP